MKNMARKYEVTATIHFTVEAEDETAARAQVQELIQDGEIGETGYSADSATFTLTEAAANTDETKAVEQAA